MLQINFDHNSTRTIWCVRLRMILKERIPFSLSDVMSMRPNLESWSSLKPFGGWISSQVSSQTWVSIPVKPRDICRKCTPSSAGILCSSLQVPKTWLCRSHLSYLWYMSCALYCRDEHVISKRCPTPHKAFGALGLYVLSEYRWAHRWG